jgi:hypothetical protein
MQEESIVREIEISDGRQIHKASYFVESGVLHARIGEKTVSLAVFGGETSDEAVRRLLLGQVQTRAWRQRMAARWFGPRTSP